MTRRTHAPTVALPPAKVRIISDALNAKIANLPFGAAMLGDLVKLRDEINALGDEHGSLEIVPFSRACAVCGARPDETHGCTLEERSK